MEINDTEKATLRQALRRQRAALSDAEARQRSQYICEHLLSWEGFNAMDTILSYVDSKENEVATRPLLQVLLEKSKQVLVPVMAPNHALRWSRLESLDDLRRGAYDILEPALEKRCYRIPPPDSCCLVPGLAFSKTGARIGYGGGYYDRFLDRYAGISIGLAYAFQLLPELPQESTDVALDYIISEAGILSSLKHRAV